MTLEDPFFVVKDEVCKALSKTRSLFQRWLELQDGASKGVVGGGLTGVTGAPGGRTPGGCGAVLVVGTPGGSGVEELEWTSTELRNSLRSIEWDLEDLDETIGIVEKNPRKFKIDTGELTARRSFIHQTKEEVKCMKNRLSSAERERNNKTNSCEAISVSLGHCGEEEINTTGATTVNMMPGGGGGGNTRYSRLVNQGEDSPSHQHAELGAQQTILHQQAVMVQQDEQLDDLASSMSVLKHMSQQVGQEVDEQAVMLDDFGTEIEHTQSKMDNTLNKIARVMHLTNDRRQWAAIGMLSVVLVIIVLLFILL